MLSLTAPAELSQLTAAKAVQANHGAIIRLISLITAPWGQPSYHVNNPQRGPRLYSTLTHSDYVSAVSTVISAIGRQANEETNC